MKKLLFTAIALFLLFLIFAIPFFRDCGFICENTASRMGYRKWFFGFKTNNWYQTSTLEKFIQDTSPEDLSHRWTSCQETGNNLFGMSISFAHGDPGAVNLLNDDVLGSWIAINDPTTIRNFYDLLVTDKEDLIEKRINEIFEEITNQ